MLPTVTAYLLLVKRWGFKMPSTFAPPVDPLIAMLETLTFETFCSKVL